MMLSSFSKHDPYTLHNRFIDMMQLSFPFTGFLLQLLQLCPDRLPLLRLLTSLDNCIDTITDTFGQIRINILFCKRRTKLRMFIKQLL